MTSSSSQDLHPTSGARFLFTRTDDAGYAVEIYAAGGARHTTTLRWDDQGNAALEPGLADEALTREVLKLARVVKRSQQERLLRWRA